VSIKTTFVPVFTNSAVKDIGNTLGGRTPPRALD